MINERELRKLAMDGIPDGGGTRAIVWKVRNIVAQKSNPYFMIYVFVLVYMSSLCNVYGLEYIICIVFVDFGRYYLVIYRASEDVGRSSSSRRDLSTSISRMIF